MLSSKSNLPFSSTRSDCALKCGSVTNCGGAATAFRNIDFRTTTFINVQHLCKKVAGGVWEEVWGSLGGGMKKCVGV